ncbi:MAG: hypothetical protein Fur003_4840 [Candidatus Dojkabacteria bacterium]
MSKTKKYINSANFVAHRYQKEILLKLAHSASSLKFNELQLEGLESEHMNYHLKQLIENGLVEKKALEYVLTDQGKEFTNLLDSETDLVEKQPKSSVIIRAVRFNKEKNAVENLLCKRLRQPYYGKVGRLTGKIRYGETLEQTVKREMLEETGLIAHKVVLETVYHKLRKRKGGEFVQDIFFYICFVADFDGELTERTSSQENFWATKEEVAKRDDLFDDFSIDIDRVEPEPLSFKESVGEAEGY